MFLSCPLSNLALELRDSYYYQQFLSYISNFTTARSTSSFNGNKHICLFVNLTVIVFLSQPKIRRDKQSVVCQVNYHLHYSGSTSYCIIIL